MGIKANWGDRGWLDGLIIKVWEDSNDGSMLPYVIRLKDTGGIVTAPMDNENFVKKGDPRFKVGDEVMAALEGGYRQVRITAVHEHKVCTSYSANLGKESIDVPIDMDQYVRPVARFSVGTEVFAKMAEGYLPGK